VRRTLLRAFCAVSLAVATTACGSSSGSGGSPTEISLWAVENKTLKGYVDSYNSSHPNEKVKLREIQFANYDAALNQAFSAKSGPDLVLVNSVTLGTFASKGFLSDITKVVPLDGDLAASNFYPGFVDQTKWKGTQVALPLDTGSRVLQWNKKLLAKAGVTPFGETVTWPEMVAAAQKVRALGSKYQGFCYAAGQNWLALYEGVGPFVHQAGGAFFDEGMTKSTINSPESVKAFNTYKDLATTGDKSDLVSQTTDDCREKLGAGTVGMVMGGFWNIPSDKESSAGFELGQSLPTDASVYSSTGGWTLSVPTYVTSKKYNILKDFLKDLYKPANIIQATGLFPATINGRDAATSLKDAKYDIYWNILSQKAGHPIALNPSLSNQATIVMEALQKIIQGQPADQVLQKAAADLDATLKG
jgi:ABC-type glycerol-3-phosphate transport system substrate-binding protein